MSEFFDYTKPDRVRREPGERMLAVAGIEASVHRYNDREDGDDPYRIGIFVRSRRRDLLDVVEAAFIETLKTIDDTACTTPSTEPPQE